MEEGKYALVLVFEAKALQLSDFEKRQVSFNSTCYTSLMKIVAIDEKSKKRQERKPEFCILVELFQFQ